MRPNVRHTAMLLAVVSAMALVWERSHSLSGALLRVSPYVTRAEAAAIVMLASPAPLPKVADNPYNDVLPTDWFAPSLLGAAKIGALSPDPTGKRMRPFGPVSRGTFVMLLGKAFGLPTFEPHGFTDVPKDSAYAPYAGAAHTYDLFSLTSKTTLEPDRLLSQDETRWAMKRFLAARAKAEVEAQRKAAAAQSRGRVQLYTIISSKRQKVVLVGDDARRAATAAALLAAQPAPPSLEDIRADILTLVNEHRATAKLPPLVRNERLERSAQTFADEMNERGFFGHVDPDGTTLKDRIEAVGYYSNDYSADCRCVKGYALAENLARGQRSAEEAVKAWMDSPSHRDAILGTDFTDTGIGVRSGIWVQHFGGVLTPEAD